MNSEGRLVISPTQEDDLRLPEHPLEISDQESPTTLVAPPLSTPQRSSSRRLSSRRPAENSNPLIEANADQSGKRRPTLKDHLRPKAPLRDPPPTLRASGLAIVKASWLNVLLCFIPVGWALHFAQVNPVIVFVCTFLSIIPLAKLLAFATEELALRVGETLGGLLNATLGNAVELIVAIIALIQCKLTIVQSSLVGSILSNLLLVLGMCFFAGGTRFSEQGFILTTSQMNSTLLVLSVIAVLLPGAFHMAITSSNNSDNNTSNDVTGAVQGSDILKMSHGVALILLVIYVCNLIFTLWSHAHVMNEKASPSTRYPSTLKNPLHSAKKRLRRHAEKKAVRPRDATHAHEGPMPNTDPDITGHSLTERVPTTSTTSHGVTASSVTQSDLEKQNEEEKEEEAQLSMTATVVLLVVVTVLVGVTAEFLVDSIDGITATGGISEEWVGLILLPIVGNAAEHVTAVTVSVKDKLDLSIGVAVGSSIQIALFVIPLMVVLAWILGKPLTMLFDPFESIVLFLAVLTVNYVVQDGKSNWLEGMILMNLYAIVAVTFWFYPGYNPSTELGLIC